jgi:hypothetical protein
MTTPPNEQPQDARGALESADPYVKDVISHEEAEQMLARFCASHFNNPTEHARIRIPADPKHDDDLRLHAYIRQRRAAESVGAPQERAEVATVRYVRVDGQVLIHWWANETPAERRDEGQASKEGTA